MLLSRYGDGQRRNKGEAELVQKKFLPRPTKRLAITSFLLLCSYSLAAADFSGPVVSVLDGDTIDVLHNTHPERIRVSGIDCSEQGQAFGNRAKQATSA